MIFKKFDVWQCTASRIIMTLDKSYSDNPMQCIYVVSELIDILRSSAMQQYTCKGDNKLYKHLAHIFCQQKSILKSFRLANVLDKNINKQSNTNSTSHSCTAQWNLATRFANSALGE